MVDELPSCFNLLFLYSVKQLFEHTSLLLQEIMHGHTLSIIGKFGGIILGLIGTILSILE